MRLLPAALIGLRVALGPLLALAIIRDAAPGWCIVLFGIAFLSDVFDGIIARRLGVASARLRLADSLADTSFYVCVGLACWWHYQPSLWRFWPGLAMLIGLEIARTILELKKFGRTAAYHMWSAKLWGVSLVLGIGELLWTGQAGGLLALAIGLGIFTDIEGLLASLLLREWVHDVPSLWHALRLHQQRMP